MSARLGETSFAACSLNWKIQAIWYESNRGDLMAHGTGCPRCIRRLKQPRTEIQGMVQPWTCFPSMDQPSMVHPSPVKKTEIKKTESKKQIRESRECSPSQKFTRRDLVITDEMRNWAESVTPLVNLEWESQIFIDHPSGQSQLFNSTEALVGAWRTWMMRGQRYAQQQASTSDRRSRSLVDDLTDTSWAEGL